MEKKEFDLFELIRILLQNRVFILIFVGIVAVSAVVYSLVTPEIWSSQASFYAVGSSGTSLPLNLPGLGGLTSSFLNMGGGDQALSFINAMESRGFAERVIREFDLIKYYELADPDSLKNMDNALKQLRTQMVTISYDEESGLIQIRAESKDKELSKNIVNYYLNHLDIYNREQKLTKSRMNREYLEKRVKITKSEIDSLIHATQLFQEKNNAIDLTAQSTAIIDSYSKIIAQKMQTDIEYQLGLQSYSADSPVLQKIQTTRDELQKQIKEMERSSNGIKPEYLIDISKLPDLGSQFAQLKLNLEIKAKVYEYLYPQYELALLDELKDMPSLDILDTPREAGLRVKPRRALICIIATFFAFIAASVMVLIKTILVNNKDRFQDIRKSL